MEPKFTDLEDLAGIGYLDFFEDYCIGVGMFKRGEHLVSCSFACRFLLD